MGWERSWTSENARRAREGRELEHSCLPGREIGKPQALFHTEACIHTHVNDFYVIITAKYSFIGVWLLAI